MNLGRNGDTPPTKGTHQMNSLRRAASGVLALALVAGGGTVLAGLATSSPAGAATKPPWEPDKGSVGGLLFFNAAGQLITGGNLTDSPVAAYVEGSSAVRSGDTVATLYGYLPVKGQPPSEWSGEQLGLSTIFPNTSAPAPLNTSPLPLETGNAGDESITTLKTDYPNKDTSTDGYAGIYQLRLYTNAPHKSQSTAYDSADILVGTSTWSVVYPTAPAITSAKTATFVKGVAGTFTVKATGMPKPTFSETGTLPTGVTLSAAGVLSGTATQTGKFPITVTASNGFGPAATQAFTLSVVGVEITTAATLPKATVNVAYTQTLSASGGATPYKWSLAAGSVLPAGLTLGASTGIISGTPTAAGSSSFTIKVTTTKTSTVNQYTGSKKFNLTVQT
jgi:hypothetical protein